MNTGKISRQIKDTNNAFFLSAFFKITAKTIMIISTARHAITFLIPGYPHILKLPAFSRKMLHINL